MNYSYCTIEEAWGDNLNKENRKKKKKERRKYHSKYEGYVEDTSYSDGLHDNHCSIERNTNLSNKDIFDVSIIDSIDETLQDKLRTLAKNYKLLPKLTNNFQFIREISCETISRYIYLTCLYSKINKTYYFFIDEYHNYWNGNCLYLKSKNKEKIFEIMGKTRNLIWENKNKDYSFRKL